MWGLILRQIAEGALKLGVREFNVLKAKKSVKDQNTKATICCTYRRSDMLPIKQIISFSECLVIITDSEIVYHRVEGGNTGIPVSFPISTPYTVEESSFLGNHFQLVTIRLAGVSYEFRFSKKTISEFEKAVKEGRDS